VYAEPSTVRTLPEQAVAGLEGAWTFLDGDALAVRALYGQDL
jgi:hypothetical protein